jgi:hypothetical protein
VVVAVVVVAAAVYCSRTVFVRRHLKCLSLQLLKFHCNEDLDRHFQRLVVAVDDGLVAASCPVRLAEECTKETS